MLSEGRAPSSELWPKPRRGGGGMSRNRGESAVCVYIYIYIYIYIYTPRNLLTGLITDCAPLVLIRLII